MLSKCPVCEHVQKVPDIYENREIKCLGCQKNYTAQKYGAVVVAKRCEEVPPPMFNPQQSPRPPQTVQIPHKTIKYLLRYAAITTVVLVVIGAVFLYRWGTKRGYAKGSDDAFGLVAAVSDVLSETEANRNCKTLTVTQSHIEIYKKQSSEWGFLCQADIVNPKPSTYVNFSVKFYDEYDRLVASSEPELFLIPNTLYPHSVKKLFWIDKNYAKDVNLNNSKIIIDIP